MVHTMGPQCGREMGKEEMLERVHLLQQLFVGGGNRGLQMLLMGAGLVI